MPISATPEPDRMGTTSGVVIVILFCYLMDLDGHGGRVARAHIRTSFDYAKGS
jgi:hypothetical protein